ncbi:MAG TPA: threonine synthase [Rhodothermales bacterium]|nr:threonine synthase [Rhodothermales bacterium]
MSPAPRYVSTRGQSPAVPFATALLDGLAPDGGLYVPDHVPALPADWRDAPTLPALASRVLTPWLGDWLAPDTLGALVDDALSFPIPLVSLEGPWEGVRVLELFHGPTLSFKDVGARTMARLTAAALGDETLTVLVATSGDTGSAVADGFAGQPGVRVVLLYPNGQVSPVQERQLIVERPGVQALAVEGTFDDCQRLVKAAFAEPPQDGVRLSSANSISVGRLLPQMLYYPWALAQSGLEDAVFCVPSGNLGNLTAGVLANLAGLPVRRFVAAHNRNRFFPRNLSGRVEPFPPSVSTLSNAMDVGAPSNFERLQILLPGPALAERVWGTSVDDAATLGTMRAVHDATGYVADPHTAVGLEGIRRYREHTGDPTPALVLSTAHPAKFPEAVQEALGVTPPTPDALAALEGRPTRVETIAPTLDALRRFL